MRPFVRLLLRYGIAYIDFANIVKQLYVDVAREDFQIDNRKQSISRISILSGLPRREVSKLLDKESSPEAAPLVYNRAVRILDAWMHQEMFLSDSGKPKSLATNRTGEGSFDFLVKEVSADIPTRAMLDELLRVGAVSIDTEGLVSLSSTGYVPTTDSEELLRVSFQSVADHITTIDFNDKHQPAQSRLQLTVNYDNVTDDGVTVFRHISREKCKEILIFLDRFLATQDRDSNTSIEGEGHNRTGLGIFYFEEKVNPDSVNSGDTLDATYSAASVDRELESALGERTQSDITITNDESVHPNA